MAYRYGNRCQMTLLPKSIEDYVGSSDPVRVYDAFIDALDFVDGTKIRANASRGKNHIRQYYEEQRGEIDKRIDGLLEGCERIDGEEGEQGYPTLRLRNTLFMGKDGERAC